MRFMKVDKVLSARLAKDVLPLLPPAAAVVYQSSKVAVCRMRKGRASASKRAAIIPAFVFNDQINFCGKGIIPGGNQFAAYYLAHELAHIKAVEPGHGKAFYAAFKELCPPDLQHYEFKYKPKAAADNGVRVA